MWTKRRTGVEQQCQHIPTQEVQQGGKLCWLSGELQEAWEREACVLFMGQENMKSTANEKSYIGGNKEEKEKDLERLKELQHK